MNAERRETWKVYATIAAILGAALLLTTPAHCANPNVCRITVWDSKGMSHGSGTLIGVNEYGEGVVVTCWHLFRESGTNKPQVGVRFRSPDGPQTEATQAARMAELLAWSQPDDLAVIAIDDPPFDGTGIIDPSAEPQVGQPVTFAGFGPSPGHYRETVAKITERGSFAPDGAAYAIWLSEQCRSGDSGGAILDEEGRLLGVISAANRKGTCGTAGERMVRFTQTCDRGICILRGGQPRGPSFYPAGQQPPPQQALPPKRPPGQQPDTSKLQLPKPPEAAPIAPAATPPVATNPGKEPASGTLAEVDGGGFLSTVQKWAGVTASGVLVVVLGAAGIKGWKARILAKGIELGAQRIIKRRRDRQAAAAVDDPPNADPVPFEPEPVDAGSLFVPERTARVAAPVVLHAPARPAVKRTETQYVESEVDAHREAYEWAKRQLVGGSNAKYPGMIEDFPLIDSLIAQYLNAKG